MTNHLTHCPCFVHRSITIKLLPFDLVHPEQLQDLHLVRVSPRQKRLGARVQWKLARVVGMGLVDADKQKWRRRVQGHQRCVEKGAA